MTPAGPVAVLDLDWDKTSMGSPVEERVIVQELRFVSVQRRSLDARELPPPVVSEAARDVLGAVKVALPRH